MFNKQFLVAFTILTSNILPCTTEVQPVTYIDYELCNDLNFGTSEEYPLDPDSNMAMTTKLIKEDDNDLVFYLYDPRAQFKYSSTSTYKVSFFYHNKKIDPDTWTKNIGFKSEVVEVKYDGCSSNGTVIKFVAPNYVSNNDIDLTLFRTYLVNSLYEDDYQYVLKDHFVLSPIDENGKSDCQYTQDNIVTLSDATVVAWAIDNSYPSWWDRLTGGSNYEKQIFYFYGFNIENFENIEQIYNIVLEYNLFENGFYYTTTPYADSWINRYVYTQPTFSKTVPVKLKYDSCKSVVDKGYKNSYEFKTYDFKEISSVSDMLLENSSNTAFTTYMCSKLSNCNYVCQFANFEYVTGDVNADEKWVNDNLSEGKSFRGPANWLADWIYENKDSMETKWIPFQGKTYFFYANSCPEVKDINVIQMKFKSNGVDYDLPVKTQPVDEVPPGNIGEDPSKDKEEINWAEIIAIAVVSVIVVVILLILGKDLLFLIVKALWKFIVWLVKFIISIIKFILNFVISLVTYPFRLLFGHKEFFIWNI